ncbi:hypothetical protein NliqN6_3734 [Naganishia liquefaciens]|uniref:HECT-type E3 ubiquitin transferase n=1 Tax=Naganishia liquefaciens TaxID=104408 RepID=A0A8H3TUC8_9TREE|nr:hypothetical protein NliqN6_3734 [Naganishia liquefaciens]
MSNHTDPPRDPNSSQDQAYPSTPSSSLPQSTKFGNKSSGKISLEFNSEAASRSGSSRHIQNSKSATSASASQQSSISGVSTSLQSQDNSSHLGRRRSSRLSAAANRTNFSSTEAVLSLATTSTSEKDRFSKPTAPARETSRATDQTGVPLVNSDSLSNLSGDKGKKRAREGTTTCDSDVPQSLPSSKRRRRSTFSQTQTSLQISPATASSKGRPANATAQGKNKAFKEESEMSTKGKAKAGSARKEKVPKKEKLPTSTQARRLEAEEHGSNDGFDGFPSNGKDCDMDDVVDHPSPLNVSGRQSSQTSTSARKGAAGVSSEPSRSEPAVAGRATRSQTGKSKRGSKSSIHDDDQRGRHERDFDIARFEAALMGGEDDDDSEDWDEDEGQYGGDIGDASALDMLSTPKSRPRSANPDRAGDAPSAGSGALSAMERLQAALRAEGFPGGSADTEALLRDARGLFGGFYGLGGFGGGSGIGSSKWKRILQELKSPMPNVRMEALNDAVNELAISMEDQLVSFPLDAAVKQFIAIMEGKPITERPPGEEEDVHVSGNRYEDDDLAAALALSADGVLPDEEDQQAQILACRCLANLMEAMPHAAHTVVAHGAVRVLCSKLTEIQYIELAEQALSTLKNISKETGSAIVRDGGLGAMLNFLDFFSTHVQQTALSAAANCCRNLSPEYFPMIRDVFPMVRTVLGYPDSKLVEQACTMVVRTLESYRHRADLLEQLLDHETLLAINNLLSPGGTSSTISSTNYTSLVKALGTAARASPTVAMSLYEADIHSSMYYNLAGVLPSSHDEIEAAVAPAEAAIMSNIGQKPKDQIEEILSLICEILPPFPTDGVFDARNYSERMLSRYKEAKAKLERETVKGNPTGKNLDEIVEAMRTRTKANITSTAVAEPSNSEQSSNDNLSSKAAPQKRGLAQQHKERNDLIEANSDIVIDFIRVLLPVLVEVYIASAATKIRTKVLGAILRAIAFCNEEKLHVALKSVPLSSFLSSILSNRDNEAFVLGVLQIVELLLNKMPAIYSRSFHREGVFYEVEKLAKEELSASAKSSQRQQPNPKSGNDVPSQDETSGSVLDRQSHEHVGVTSNTIERKSPAGSTGTGGRKVSSVPTDPHDVNIVRARILCIKADLGAASEDEQQPGQSPVTSIVKGLGETDNSVDAFRNMMRLVAGLLTDKEEPLSSFELLQSGLLEKLMELIVNGDTDVIQERRQILYEVLSTGGGESSALVLLIKRLQESLSRMENFEVESASAGSEESKGSSLNNLVRQIRLRLMAEDGTDVPRACREMMVSVQAIAPLSAINSWLRSRVVSISNGGSGAANGLSSMLEAAYASRYDAQNRSTSGNTGTRTSGFSRKSDQSTDTKPANQTPPSQQIQPGSADTQSSWRRSDRLRGSQPSAGVSHDSDKKDVSPSSPSAAVEGSTGEQNFDNAADNVEHDTDADHDNDHDVDDDGENGDSDEEDEYDDVIFEDDMDDDMHDDIDRPQEQTVDLSLPEDGSKPEATTPSGTRVTTPTNGTSAAESSKTGDLPSKIGSYAAAVRAPPSDWHFQFLIGSEELSMADTVYGALHRSQTASPEGKPKQSIFWQQPVIKFKRVEGPAPVLGIQSAASAPVEPASTSALPSTLPTDSAQATVLRMLRVLHALNTEKQDSGETANTIDEAVFINPKLTAKFARQLEELVIVASNCLPDWAMDLPTHFPFLFPFEARYTYLQSTSFGYSRLISKWMAQQGPAESNRRLGMLDVLPRVQRSRVRISRSKILESAARVMELYGASPGVLEIEYQDEEGTGLGPTLEFYTLVSRAFAERKLGLWRDDDESIGGLYVHHPRGLFPRPLKEGEELQHPNKSDYPLFKSLGTFVGKALLDSRIIDINFSKVFLRAVMGEILPLDLSTLRQVDPKFAQTMDKFQQMVEQKVAIQSDETLHQSEKSEKILALRLDGVRLEELGLDFVLPGDHSIELIANGANIPVTTENVEEYVEAVLDYTLRRGISRQVEAFRQGFSIIFPVSDLNVFSAAELALLFGNPEEDWSRSTLEQSIKADHGYNADSRQIKYLIDVLSSYSKEERRSFLQFATGAPKLPIGGFKGLHPQFTVVRKPHEPPFKPDNYLPSVMTCAQYFKMPEYTSKEVLKLQIERAMREGANSFLLS